MRMENEPWDSALFDWKPTKFYLCPPLLKGGNSRILWNSPKKMYVGERIQRSNRQRTNSIFNTVGIEPLAALYLN